MTINTEGGLRPSRIEFVPEDVQGVTPTDPEFQLPSDRVTQFETDGFGPEAVEKMGLGDIDYEIEPGLEEPSLTLAYDLQRWLKDASGDPDDLSAYGILRVANQLYSSVTIVERMQSGDMDEGPTIEPESTVEYKYNGTEGATRRESRVYTVAKGCDIAEPTLNANPEDVTWAAELSIDCEHGRSYQIDQPTEATYLHIESTSSDDTNLHVVIEAEDATLSETVQLDGSDATSAVATTETFGDIDAIEVYEDEGGSPGDQLADHAGDIVVYDDDGSGTDAPGSSNEALAVLYGSDFYGNTYGDPGVPTLGAGSRGTEIGSEYFKVGNLGVFRPPGSLFEAAGSVQSVELSFGNETERSPQQRSREQRIHQGMRAAEASITYDSETGSHRGLVQRMSMNEEDTRFEFVRDGSQFIDYHNSVVTESGRNRSAGENEGEQEMTLRAQKPGITVSDA